MTFTKEQLVKQLDYQWSKVDAKVDWLSMETLLDRILNADLNAFEKVALAKECIDAFTKRGHFHPSDYLESYRESN